MRRCTVSECKVKAVRRFESVCLRFVWGIPKFVGVVPDIRGLDLIPSDVPSGESRVHHWLRWFGRVDGERGLAMFESSWLLRFPK